MPGSLYLDSPQPVYIDTVQGDVYINTAPSTGVSMIGQGETPASPVALPPINTGGMKCTKDVRECPDGSYVTRQGPRCEFPPCPGTGRMVPGGAGGLVRGNLQESADALVRAVDSANQDSLYWFANGVLHTYLQGVGLGSIIAHNVLESLYLKERLKKIIETTPNLKKYPSFSLPSVFPSKVGFLKILPDDSSGLQASVSKLFNLYDLRSSFKDGKFSFDPANGTVSFVLASPKAEIELGKIAIEATQNPAIGAVVAYSSTADSEQEKLISQTLDQISSGTQNLADTNTPFLVQISPAPSPVPPGPIPPGPIPPGPTPPGPTPPGPTPPGPTPPGPTPPGPTPPSPTPPSPIKGEPMPPSPRCEGTQEEDDYGNVYTCTNLRGSYGEPIWLGDDGNYYSRKGPGHFADYSGKLLG